MSLISQIIQGLKNKVRPNAPVWVVIGNESCDLDSAVSAITYSALLAQEGLCVTAILNVARSDYPLKTEVRYWLNKHGLTEEFLVFRDELVIKEDNLQLRRPMPSTAEYSSVPADLLHQHHQASAVQETVPLTSVRVCLVDHHVLAHKDALLKPYVKRFIDHRPLEPGCEVADESSTHSIVGSCCTLITELVQRQHPQLLHALAPLLHGCILLDCVNCLPAAGRATPRDEAALHLLETFMSPTDRSAVFTELTTAKASVEHLTSAQLLQRDAKMVRSVRVSGLTTTVREFLSREDAVAALQENCDSAVASTSSCRSDAPMPLSLTFVVGLTLEGDTPFRDLVVYSTDTGLLERACSSLQQGSLHLQDGTPELRTDAPLRYFVQGNLKASRKQILPLVQRFVAEETRG